MKVASLKITKVFRAGISYWSIYVPAALSATGKKGRRYYKTQLEAQAARSALLQCARNGGAAPPLSAAQEADARAAWAFLAKQGCELSLLAVCELALPLLGAQAVSITVGELLDEFAKSKDDTWSALSKRNFRFYGARLRERFGDDKAAAVTARALESWLEATYPSKPARAAAIRTLRPAFSYAARREYIPASPFATIEKVQTSNRGRTIDIYTPEEARALMMAAPEDCKPAFALLLFAGIRPAELQRLTWGDVREEFIHVGTGAAKTAQARNVDIVPTLRAWLTRARACAPDSLIIPGDWRRKFDRTRRAAGLTGRPDAARHSFASYLLATTRDENAVKTALGHSRNSNMLFVHYRAAATREAAAAYWGILPEA